MQLRNRTARSVWSARYSRALLSQNCLHRPRHRFCLLIRSNGDPQVVPHFRVIKPPDEDFALSQFPEPFLSRKPGRPNQNEIRLARKCIEPNLLQLVTQALARCNDLSKV